MRSIFLLNFVAYHKTGANQRRIVNRLSNSYERQTTERKNAANVSRTFSLIIPFKAIFRPLVIRLSGFHNAAVVLPFRMVWRVRKTLGFQRNTTVIRVLRAMSSRCAGEEIAGVNL